MIKPLLYVLSSIIMLSIGWLETSGLPLIVALIPLLALSDRAGEKRRDFWKTALYVALAFGIWSGITTWWVWLAAPIGAIMSVLITVTLFGGVFMLYHHVSKRASRGLAYTILVSGWIAMEVLYTNGELSFPWLMLGNGLANDVWAVQWYEYTGVFGGSLWILICNIAIYEAVKRRTVAHTIGAIVAVALPLVVSGWIYASYHETGREIKVQVVQPNLDPYEEKFDLPQQEQTAIMVELAMEAPSDVDYIIMPETAIDDQVVVTQTADNESLNELRAMLRQHYPSAQVVTGATTFRYYHDGDKRSRTARTNDNINFWYDVYNTALTVDTTSAVQMHHKSKLVVGVEKMPFYNILRHFDFMTIDLGGITGQLGVDSVNVVFGSPQGSRMGGAICYEGIYGSYFAQFARNGAEVMSIISNDGWWGNTAGHRQLVGFSRLRAIESRRSIARSANTGISAVINQRGDIVVKSKWWERDSLSATIRTNNKITFYAIYGDLVGRISIYTLLLSLLYYIAYRTKRRSHLM